MEAANILLLVDLLTKGLAKMQAYAAAIMKARSEGRDVSRAELDAMFADDDVARAALQAAIDARK